MNERHKELATAAVEMVTPEAGMKWLHALKAVQCSMWFPTRAIGSGLLGLKDYKNTKLVNELSLQNVLDAVEEASNVFLMFLEGESDAEAILMGAQPEYVPEGGGHFASWLFSNLNVIYSLEPGQEGQPERYRVHWHFVVSAIKFGASNESQSIIQRPTASFIAPFNQRRGS
jgi:hypothetical protein